MLLFINMAQNGNKEEHILEVKASDKYKTADELFKRSQPNSVYYTLLILSAVIIAAGLLLNNNPIVIGGMLITPVLTPVLAISLGLIVNRFADVKNTSLLILKSFLLIILISLLLSLLLGFKQDIKILENTVRAAILYFIVALGSGIAATFAWIRKEISDVLPGVSIAVSLVPPLSLAGIWLSVLNLDNARFYFLVFLFNLIGILVGSFAVFYLLKFYKVK